MAEGKRKRPRWKLPELSERGSREWDADPEGWEWKRRRTLALSKIEYLIRYGSDMVAFLASKEVTDRTDPKPKEGVNLNLSGPVVIEWQGGSSSLTSRGSSSGNSTTPLTGSSRALPSSSATDDLGSL